MENTQKETGFGYAHNITEVHFDKAHSAHQDDVLTYIADGVPITVQGEFHLASKSENLYTHTHIFEDGVMMPIYFYSSEGDTEQHDDTGTAGERLRRVFNMVEPAYYVDAMRAFVVDLDDQPQGMAVIYHRTIEDELKSMIADISKYKYNCTQMNALTACLDYWQKLQY